jgi:alkanesulfonate monooxygenase SsuD/methylene tetrahydromethanopterin reductase-like flavin-dependent oxidoreductase (luciferase family)
MATPLSKPDAEVQDLSGKLAQAIAKFPDRPRPRFMVLRRTCVYEDPRDWRIPADAAYEDLRIFNGLFFNAAGVIEGFATPVDPAQGDATQPPAPETLRENLMFGTPDQVVARLRRYEAWGCDLYCYGASFGLPHEVAMRSLQLFARDVMPHFATRPAPAGLGARR